MAPTLSDLIVSAITTTTAELRFGLLFGVSLSYSDIVMEDTPVAYWRMEELSGNIASEVGSFPGTVNNANLTPSILGSLGSAISFTGANGSNVGFTTSPLATATQATVELWVEPLVGYVVGGDRWEYLFHYGPSNNVGDARIWIGRTGTQHSNAVGKWGVGLNGNWTVPQSNVDFDTSRGVPTHVVMTFDGSTVRLYLNNVLVIERAQAAMTFGSHSIRLANRHVSRNYAGKVDEVALYNYALSPARIAAHYNKAME